MSKDGFKLYRWELPERHYTLTNDESYIEWKNLHVGRSVEVNIDELDSDTVINVHKDGKRIGSNTVKELNQNKDD